MKCLERMTEEQRKAWANEQARRHEEKRVAEDRKHKHLSWRISREFDVLTVTKTGWLHLIDCKRSDNGEFTIDGYDIDKILDLATKWKGFLGIQNVECRFDMWFSRTRQKNNRRDIIVTEEDRGWSIKCTKTPKKIMTQRVKRGSQEEREADRTQCQVGVISGEATQQ